jgi:hypothetical protein
MARQHASPTLNLGMCMPDPERPESPPSVARRLRCAVCRDVIGVYEPLVHVLEDLAWRTSLAAEPGVASAGGEHYHADCYARTRPEPQPGTD